MLFVKVNVLLEYVAPVVLTSVGKFWYVVADIVFAVKPFVKFVDPVTVPPLNGRYTPFNDVVRFWYVDADIVLVRMDVIPDNIPFSQSNIIVDPSDFLSCRFDVSIATVPLLSLTYDVSKYMLFIVVAVNIDVVNPDSAIIKSLKFIGEQP